MFDHVYVVFYFQLIIHSDQAFIFLHVSDLQYWDCLDCIRANLFSTACFSVKCFFYFIFIYLLFFTFFSLSNTISHDSEKRRVYFLSLTWNATKAHWNAACQSSVITILTLRLVGLVVLLWVIGWAGSGMKREREGERESVYVKWEAWGCPEGLGWGKQNAHIAQASAVLSNSSPA